MTVAEKIVKKELQELRDNTRRIEELAKEIEKECPYKQAYGVHPENCSYGY